MSQKWDMLKVEVYNFLEMLYNLKSDFCEGFVFMLHSLMIDVLYTYVLDFDRIVLPDCLLWSYVIVLDLIKIIAG